MESMVEVRPNGRNEAVTSPVWDLKQVAAYLHVSVGWTRRLVYAGQLPYQVLGKRYVVPRSAVEEFLKRGWRRNGK